MPRLLRFTRSECSILFTPFNFPPVAAETWSWRNFFRLSTFCFANGWDVAIPQGTWLLASNSRNGAGIAVGRPAEVFNVCECFPFHRRGAPCTYWKGECLQFTRSVGAESCGDLRKADRFWWTWCGMNDDERCRRTWSQMISEYFIISYHISSYCCLLLPCSLIKLAFADLHAGRYLGCQGNSTKPFCTGLRLEQSGPEQGLWWFKISGPGCWRKQWHLCSRGIQSLL